jgi:hypothetical protein
VNPTTSQLLGFFETTISKVLAIEMQDKLQQISLFLSGNLSTFGVLGAIRTMP